MWHPPLPAGKCKRGGESDNLCCVPVVLEIRLNSALNDIFKMAVNLNKNRESILAAWKDVVDDKSPTNW